MRLPLGDTTLAKPLVFLPRRATDKTTQSHINIAAHANAVTDRPAVPDLDVKSRQVDIIGVRSGKLRCGGNLEDFDHICHRQGQLHQ